MCFFFCFLGHLHSYLVCITSDRLRPFDGCLFGFIGNQVELCKYVELHTTFSYGEATNTITIKYIVVNAPSSYNLLLGRPSMNKLGAVVSTSHTKLKLLGRSEDRWRTYTITTHMGRTETENDHERCLEPVEEVREIENNKRLSSLGRHYMRNWRTNWRRSYKETWHFYMVNCRHVRHLPNFLCHRLNLESCVKLVVQRRQRHNEKKQKTIKEEIGNIRIVWKKMYLS